jgi:phage terminase Nu1 subunit (DNA packaging protein)
MSAKPKPHEATSKELCDLLNLTEARVTQLIQQGILHRLGRNRYDLWGCARAYIEYLQTKKTNQHGPTGNADLDAERLRKTTEEADKLALANARSRGELVEIHKVTKLGQKVLIAVRNRILSMPMTDEEKDSCLRELLALKEMDWTREP